MSPIRPWLLCLWALSVKCLIHQPAHMTIWVTTPIQQYKVSHFPSKQGEGYFSMDMPWTLNLILLIQKQYKNEEIQSNQTNNKKFRSLIQRSDRQMNTSRIIRITYVMKLQNGKTYEDLDHVVSCFFSFYTSYLKR